MNSDDVMLDLETLDTRPGAVLLSLGAVFFDEDGLGEEFHAIISRPQSEALGLTVSEGTVAWWERQPDAAKETLRLASSPHAVAPADAFREFNLFLLKAPGGNGKVRLWGNGSDFDNVLLIAAMAAADVTPVWKYYNHRCYRTLKGLRPELKLERTGVYHNALDDAKTQALHAGRLLKELK